MLRSPLSLLGTLVLDRMGLESKNTASRCTTETVRGTHAFEIVGYSLKKGIGVGQFVRSATFTVGGYDRAIRFYPDGASEASKEYVSVYLELMSDNAEVRAFYDLKLLDQATRLRNWGVSPKQPRVFNSRETSRCRPRTAGFKLRSDLELEESGYIRHNCLTIKCVLTVVKESQVSETTGNSEIEVPPSDLSAHYGKLLLEEEGADVTFSVGGETFPVHKIVMATRSPVFKAEFYGQMRESTGCITIEDMQPSVFRALLHFIYTDSLPDLDDLDGDDNSEMIRHLLVAADRYAMDRLKLICQSILGKKLDVETVSTTLALADQHNCDRLKEVCIEFIASSNEMDAVAATQGYANLKRTCPSVLVDVFEKTSRLCKP